MKNKSTSPVSESIQNTSEEVPVELFELSDEDLQQIVGGFNIWHAITDTVDAITDTVIDNRKAIVTTVVKVVTTGSVPTDQKTVHDLLDPLPIGVARRLFPKLFPW